MSVMMLYWQEQTGREGVRSRATNHGNDGLTPTQAGVLLDLGEPLLKRATVTRIQRETAAGAQDKSRLDEGID